MATNSNPDQQPVTTVPPPWLQVFGDPKVNAMYIYEALISRGKFTINQAAGIMANIQVESAGTFAPNIAQLNKFDNIVTAEAPIKAPTSDGGLKQRGFGVAQWTDPVRQQKLVAFAKGNGLKPDNLDMQIDFLLKEIKETATLNNKLRSANTAADAAEIFLRDFEIPKEIPKNVDERRRIASEYVAQINSTGEINPGPPIAIIDGKLLAQDAADAKKFKPKTFFDGTSNNVEALPDVVGGVLTNDPATPTQSPENVAQAELQYVSNPSTVIIKNGASNDVIKVSELNSDSMVEFGGEQIAPVLAKATALSTSYINDVIPKADEFKFAEIESMLPTSKANVLDIAANEIMNNKATTGVATKDNLILTEDYKNDTFGADAYQAKNGGSVSSAARMRMIEGFSSTPTPQPVATSAVAAAAQPAIAQANPVITGGYTPTPASGNYGAMEGLSNASMVVETAGQTSARIAGLEKFANDDPNGFAAIFVP